MLWELPALTTLKLARLAIGADALREFPCLEKLWLLNCIHFDTMSYGHRNLRNLATIPTMREFAVNDGSFPSHVLTRKTARVRIRKGVRFGPNLENSARDVEPESVQWMTDMEDYEGWYSGEKFEGWYGVPEEYFDYESGSESD